MPTANQTGLSVVIPNYNHAQYLPQCLNALVDQSRRPLEIIVIDDASKDNSLEIIRDFCARHPFIRWHANAENHGVVYNMNLGLAMARGEHVYLGGADDQVLPGFFEKCMGLLAQHPQAGLCSGICEWRDHQTGYTWPVGAGLNREPCYFSPDALAQKQKVGALQLPSNSIIFRRDALIEMKGFQPELKWHTDWMAIQLVGFRYGICYYPELFSVFNINPKSYSQGTWSRNNREVLAAMLHSLARESYGGASARIIQSGALSSFGGPMLRLMLRHARYRKFINGTFLRQNLWHSTKVTVRKVLPARLAKWYYRTFFRPPA